ncbi:Transcriptional regulator PadR family [Patulibacter medicamentivorans]|uniref:Transcriptional regulator PadR family n=1 Tax=Patulibacter medicamentivorans TaxID=1097667 RepID=H0E3K6_9ACTN|nr:PadR family transcriptional regulator [Patulibacter medicamentivorans]EHN11757.1 Transcriptional regulator PadR family [Patulibacter medicamentivorans]
MTRQDSIRLSGTSYAVLGLVRHLGRATPYDLKQLIAESLDNFWPVPHTTFYAEPTRLAAAGYLVEEQEPGGRRRKVYELTDQGRQALERWVADPASAAPVLHDEGVLKVFLGADPSAVFGARRDWHETKIGELERHLEGIRFALDGDPPNRGSLEGIAAALAAGIAFHRTYLTLLDEQLADQGP